MDWHRSTELPKYQAHLKELMSDIKENQIDDERIAYHREKGKGHWERARAHVAPDIVTMSKTLSDDQITYFFAKLEKQNIEEEEEDAEASQLSASERSKKWVKRNERGAKKWIGRLNEEQKQHIAQFRDRFQRTGEYWLTYRRAYQQALREVFASEDRSSAFNEKLTALILTPEAYRSEAFLAASEANQSASAEYLIGMLELADKKQVKRLLGDIEDLAQDLSSLQQ
jgi:hypothetical protein